MGRGKAFNHKKKGHESQVPKYATNNAEFSVEPINNKLQKENKG